MVVLAQWNESLENSTVCLQTYSLYLSKTICSDLSIPGVKSYNVSLENQTADITTAESLGYDAVLEKIKKTGKTVNSGEADGQAMAV